MKIFAKAGKARAGFTLIELLVVIAIIGILSTLVTVSLNAARQKARDTRRISDIRQLQTALQLYFDANGAVYPSALSDLSPLYLSVMPLDPFDGAPYRYCVSSNRGYHLGTKEAGLEQDNIVLDGDTDAGAGGNPVDGCDEDSFVGTDPVYDVIP